MAKTEGSIVIDAPVEVVFAYANDPKNLPDYWVGVTEVKDIKRLPNGGSSFKAVQKFAGMRFERTNEAVEYIPNERAVYKSYDTSGETTITAKYERMEGGKTRLSGVTTYPVPTPILGKMSESFYEQLYGHAMELTLESLKARMELAVPAGAAR